MALQTRRLGRTGHHSSLAILGGAAYWDATPEAAEASFHMALERGVNHLDIAPSYGVAERVIGPLIPAVRDRMFITEKTNRSNPDGARAQMEQSLQLFGCDFFDVYQAHGVTSLAVLDERAAAIEAILQARDEGLCRYVGITGHDLGAPRAHLTAVKRWNLDTVMFPMYPRVWADPVYRADATELLDYCAANDVGVMVIKAIAHRPWGDDRKIPGSPWYRPQVTDEGISRGVRFALSTPGVHAFCTAGDIGLLPRVLAAAEAFEPLDGEQHDSVAADAADWPLIFPLAEHAR